MTTAAHEFIIVGAGLAGAKAAQTLRSQGHTGPIILVGSEADVPYNRPPLSKDYLNGTTARAAINVLPHNWYAEHDVQLLLSSPATGIDPVQHRIILSSGRRLDYAKLLLATGSRVRRLDLPGSDLDGVLYLRTVSDSDHIQQALSAASRIVIIGGGWIGLEIAAAARTRGVDVTLLEASRLPLLKVLGTEVAQHFFDLHISNGVDLRCGAVATGITGSAGRATGVDLADGSHIEADAVIVGVGATPRTELAEAAGLAVDNGILVDARLQTSHPDVYAAGDVANAWHPVLGRHIRVEHWDNASWQPRAAARAMLGSIVSYDRLPYFFTDQYDLSMEYAGFVGPQGYDRVVFRGDPSAGAFVAFYLLENRVLAGMHVNTPEVVRDITAIIRSGQRFDADLLADASHPLDTLLDT